jgi:hypothetical protein
MFGGCDAGRTLQAARLQLSDCARFRREDRCSEGAFYAYPDISCAFQKEGILTPMAFAEQCYRRRTWPSYLARRSAPTSTSALLRGIDGRVASAVSIESTSSSSDECPATRTEVCRTGLGNNGFVAVVSTSRTKSAKSAPMQVQNFVINQVHLYFSEAIGSGIPMTYAKVVENSRGKRKCGISFAEPDLVGRFVPQAGHARALRASIADGGRIAELGSCEGDTYYAAAGTVHAIGAGISLCEIQQNSDVTYRLTGRPRELHLEKD